MPFVPSRERRKQAIDEALARGRDADLLVVAVVNSYHIAIQQGISFLAVHESGTPDEIGRVTTVESENARKPSIDGPGRFVAFISESSSLAGGDTNGVDDIFVRDRATGQVARVSVNTEGLEANGPSDDPVISANGRWVAFSAMRDERIPVSRLFVRAFDGTADRQRPVSGSGWLPVW